MSGASVKEGACAQFPGRAQINESARINSEMAMIQDPTMRTPTFGQ